MKEPWTAEQIRELSRAFGRSADWLDKGLLHGPARDFPLVGTADFRLAAQVLMVAASFWETSNTEG